jgi:hypothetical protein
MLAHMSGPAANSTAHAAIAVEATMAWLSRSDARQSQQLPQCVDRPMGWVRQRCYRRRRVPWVLKAGSCTCPPLSAEPGACAAVCGRHDAAGLDGLHRWQHCHVPLWAKPTFECQWFAMHVQSAAARCTQRAAVDACAYACAFLC